MEPVIAAAFSFISLPFGGTVVFLMLFKHLNKTDKLKKLLL